LGLWHDVAATTTDAEIGLPSKKEGMTCYGVAANDAEGENKRVPRYTHVRRWYDTVTSHECFVSALAIQQSLEKTLHI